MFRSVDLRVDDASNGDGYGMQAADNGGGRWRRVCGFSPCSDFVSPSSVGLGCKRWTMATVATGEVKDDDDGHFISPSPV